MTKEDNLMQAISCLKTTKLLMEEVSNFDQLASGCGAETYGETIDKLIEGIDDYLQRQ